MMTPVTPEEVKAAAVATKVLMAPGADGRTTADLESLGQERLCWFMSVTIKLVLGRTHH